MASSKKVGQMIHAKRRFSERHGITLSEDLHSTLVKQIMDNVRARFHCPQSNRVSIWIVEVDKKFVPGSIINVEVPVVYDKTRKQITSALPIVCLDVNQIGIYEQ